MYEENFVFKMVCLKIDLILRLSFVYENLTDRICFLRKDNLKKIINVYYNGFFIFIETSETSSVINVMADQISKITTMMKINHKFIVQQSQTSHEFKQFLPLNSELQLESFETNLRDTEFYSRAVSLNQFIH